MEVNQIPERNKPDVHTVEERKHLKATTYFWLVLALAVIMLPVVNFIAFPVLALIGALALIGFVVRKVSHPDDTQQRLR